MQTQSNATRPQVFEILHYDPTEEDQLGTEVTGVEQLPGAVRKLRAEGHVVQRIHDENGEWVLPDGNLDPRNL